MKDERMRLTTEVFSNAKTVKLFSWQEFFREKISDVYRKEMALNSVKLIAIMGVEGMWELASSFMPIMIFIQYAYAGHEM